VVFQDYIEQLGISYSDLNNIFAANYIGLAFSCIIFIPFSLKYGHQLFYLVSQLVQFLCAIWSASLRTYPNMTAVNIFDGLAGAVVDKIVQMSVILVYDSKKSC
jgi:MFS family permease